MDELPPPTVELRRAVAADATFMHDLAREAYQHYVPRVGAEPGPMRDDYAARIDEDECWVASVHENGDAAPVGMLVLRLAHTELWIDNIAVRPDRQGHGIGHRLLQFAEQRARAHGRDEIRLYTHVTMVENIDRYTRFGYVETHREEQHGFRRVFMAKQLS